MRRLLYVLCLTAGMKSSARSEPLPNTKPLTREGDLAMQMVEGIDKYLMRELEASVAKRKEFWKPDFSSVEAYTKSVEPNRQRLRKILGVVDERVPFKDLEYVGGPKMPSLVAETDLYKVHAVRWPVLSGVEGEGLLLEPKGKIVANVVAIPDADWTPEMLVGLAPGVPKESQFARRLAENGCRVIVPVLINRRDDFSGSLKLNRWTNQPHREFLYRMSFQMGRHIIGYEVQKILAAVDWFSRETGHPPVGLFGYGEGGLLALCSAALDRRIELTNVSGYFGDRQGIWKEPIYRNVWRYLAEFDNALLAQLIAPRALYVEHAGFPEVKGPPEPGMGRGGAAPGQLVHPAKFVSAAELRMVKDLRQQLKLRELCFHESFSSAVESKVAPGFSVDFLWSILGKAEGPRTASTTPIDLRQGFVLDARQQRQFDQLVNFTQKLMRDSEADRAKTFWAKLDTSSPEKYAASTEPFRKQLWEEVIGKLPAPTLPINPQTRQILDEPKWTGYEVTLDLYPDVFAEGILLLPKDLKPGEKRPVVVCQHGLEGRPTDVVNPKMKTKYYNSFGAALADKGYIVYAPQNPYIGQDKFRVLQRKANPLGLSLFSFIIRQHERTLDWLATLPNVDPDKIAFYGLSYGGKTAMRVPAILPRYCLSICSGDFNEWTWKNVSVDFRGSYMFTGEYEMPEFNMGHTIVYAEMAALIAPRPFMVERGHDDGVGIDEWVSYEYAKVRRLYSRLNIPDKTELEYFAGGHEIHGQGTYRFLQKHLGWPR